MEFQVTPLGQPPAPIIAPSRSLMNPRNAKLLVTGVIVILLAAVGFFFLFHGSFTQNGVTFTIEGPSEIAGGDLVQYKVHYTNTNKTSLTSAHLEFSYPQDAVPFQDNQIGSSSTLALDLGTINAGETGERDFQAFVIGNLGDIKTARAMLSYTPQTLSSTYQAQASLATTITRLAVPITISVPPNIVSGQTLTYLIDYRNQSSSDLANLRFKVVLPDGFKVASTTPKPSVDQNLWDVPVLKQGDGNRISIRGILSGSEQSQKKIVVIAQRLVSTVASQSSGASPAPSNAPVIGYVDFEKAEASSTITSPPLSLDLTVNQSADYVAHLGDTLNYTLTFHNNTDAIMNSLALSAKLDGSMFDTSSVDAQGGFFDSRTNTITWNASTVPQLDTFQPHQSGSVTFSVRLQNSFGGSGVGATNSLVKVSAHLDTPNIPAGITVDHLAVDQDLITRISGAPTFAQSVFLHDDQLGGSGPFPPRVNQKTIFTIRWKLTNPSNNITKAKVFATLPAGVTWENHTRVSGTQSQPVYNKRSSQIVWDVGSLPGGVGLAFPAYEADFQVSITPSSNQVDSPVMLLTDSTFEGIDSTTQERLAKTFSEATTARVSDTTGNGAIVP